jgi:hypothetical protein
MVRIAINGSQKSKIFGTLITTINKNIKSVNEKRCSQW